MTDLRAAGGEQILRELAADAHRKRWRIHSRNTCRSALVSYASHWAAISYLKLTFACFLAGLRALLYELASNDAVTIQGRRSAQLNVFRPPQRSTNHNDAAILYYAVFENTSVIAVFDATYTPVPTILMI